MKTHKKQSSSFEISFKSGKLRIRKTNSIVEIRPTPVAPWVTRQTVAGLMTFVLTMVVVTGCGLAWQTGSITPLATLAKSLSILIGAIIKLAM